jgi:hypothetical protein
MEAVYAGLSKRSIKSFAQTSLGVSWRIAGTAVSSRQPLGKTGKVLRLVLLLVLLLSVILTFPKLRAKLFGRYVAVLVAGAWLVLMALVILR